MFLSAGVAVVFFFLGALSHKHQTDLSPAQAAEKNINQIRQSAFGESGYKFIDPLLACSVTNDKDVKEFEPLKEKISSLINSRIFQGAVGTVSVYFDNRNGNWLSINPAEKYSPASLIKVPVGMAFLKIAESDPAILKKEIINDSPTDANEQEYYKPDQKLTVGQSYKIEDLLASMLGSSDNNALYLLLNNIQVALLDEVTTDLGVVIPRGSNNETLDFITIKQYANFFRVLHNASYLSRAMSEKTLALMSQTDFKQGLNLGLPAGLTVAHKFGERDLGEQKELHDCVIIYYPERPYLLCVMTKGGNFEDLSQTIGDISRLVYDFIKKTD